MGKKRGRKQQQKDTGGSTAVKTGFTPAYTVERSFKESDPPQGEPVEDVDMVYADVIEVPSLSEKVGFPCLLVTGDVKYVDRDDMPSNLCYIIAGNGTFIYKKNALFPSLTKVEGLGSLAELTEYCWYQESPIPNDIVRKIVGFFKAVYDKHKSEAIVLLYHNQKTQGWTVLVPKQVVSGGSANYAMVTPDQVPDGFSRVGTWHSHANMSAFFSGVDDHDDHRDDGLHLTLGDLGTRWGDLKDQFLPSIVASYASNGTRWSAKPYWVMDAPVKVLEEITTKQFKAGHVTQETKTDTEYVLRFDENDDISFPAEWMEKVSHMAITTVKHGTSGGSIVPFASTPRRGYGVTEQGNEYGSCWTYRRGNSYTAYTRNIGCAECAAYQTRTSFDALGDAIDVLRNPENDALLQAFMKVEDRLGNLTNEEPTPLDGEYFEQITALHDSIEKKDKKLSEKLSVRDILWLLAMVHDEALYEYFDKYYDWWLMHRNQGSCYCVNPYGMANDLQARFAHDEYEPMDFDDESFEECDQFYPFGGYSWDAPSWNAKMDTYWNEALAFNKEYDSDIAIHVDKYSCYDCAKFKAILQGGSDQCEKFIEVLSLMGIEGAEEVAWNDRSPCDCDRFVDYWNSDDIPFEETLGELAEKSLAELNSMFDEGQITPEEYMEACLIQEYEGGGC